MRFTLGWFYRLVNSRSYDKIRFIISDVLSVFIPIIDDKYSIGSADKTLLNYLMMEKIPYEISNDGFVFHEYEKDIFEVAMRNYIITENVSHKELSDLISNLIKEYGDSEVISVTVNSMCEFKKNTGLSIEVKGAEIHDNDFVSDGETNLF